MHINKRIRIALSGVVILLLCCITNVWSVFKQPLAAEFGWSDAQLSWVYNVCMSCTCIGGMLSAVLCRRLRHATVLRLSGLFMLCGFVLSSFATESWMICLSWGVFIGLSIGMSSNVMLAVGCGWFPDRTGLIAGVLTMSMGLGSLIFAPVSMSLLSAVGWQNTFCLYGIVYFVVFLLASLPTRMPVMAELEGLQAASDKRVGATPGQEHRPGQMLRRSAFWLFFCWCVLFGGIGLALMSQLFTIAAYAGMGDMTAALMVSMTGAAHGAGRLCFGAMYDAKGLRFTLVSATAATLVSAGVMVIAVQGGSPLLMAAVFLVLGFSTGCTSPSCSSFARGFFGKENYQANLAIINIYMLFSVFVSQYAGSWLYMRTGGFVAMALAIAAMSVLCMLCAFLIKKPAA